MTEIREYWQIIVSAVIGIAWLIRLEGKVTKNADEVARLERLIERERADTREAFSELKEMQAEANRDIKILLGRGHQVHWNDRTHPPR
ncbi:hypothetical protein [uncultured Paracoccus sp.]|uniref:hypothetical protein n=1 Tax=uncultured Paracoccus sp. TaxID=189685 RepID=UPI0025F503F8|nr:hypothetical protein [uncultured Paracoccus sp.]